MCMLVIQCRIFKHKKYVSTKNITLQAFVEFVAPCIKTFHDNQLLQKVDKIHRGKYF